MTRDAYTQRLSLTTLPDLGQHFRSLRKQARKTQSDVASAVGMRQEALSRFESGRATDFSLAKFLRLLQALDLELEVKPVTGRPTLNDILEERRSGANTGPASR
jgi:transcriptional regulator with XRE-family HTH domain